MIKADEYYQATVTGAKWFPGDDGDTLGVFLAVGEDKIARYLDTNTEENIERMKRELKAIGVDEAMVFSEQFVDNPESVIGNPDCRIKTRMTRTGKVTVAFICDPRKSDLTPDRRQSLLTKLRGGATAKPAADDSWPSDDALPF